MKKPLVLAGAVCLFSFSSGAVPILLNGPVNGSKAKPELELGRLQSAVEIYNAAHEFDLPNALSIDSSPYLADGGVLNNSQVQTKSSPSSISIDFSSERANYLMLKFGNQDLFYYVGSESGLVTFENTQVLNKKGKPLGLSHYVIFDSFAPPTAQPAEVPEGAGTFMLFLIGCTCLAGFGKALLSPSKM